MMIDFTNMSNDAIMFWQLMGAAFDILFWLLMAGGVCVMVYEFVSYIKMQWRRIKKFVRRVKRRYAYLKAMEENGYGY